MFSVARTSRYKNSISPKFKLQDIVGPFNSEPEAIEYIENQKALKVGNIWEIDNPNDDTLYQFELVKLTPPLKSKKFFTYRNYRGETVTEKFDKYFTVHEGQVPKDSKTPIGRSCAVSLARTLLLKHQSAFIELILKKRSPYDDEALGSVGLRERYNIVYETDKVLSEDE